jgi:hypothetical protein
MNRIVPALLLLAAGCVTESEYQERQRQKAGGYLELRQVVPNAKVTAALAVDSLTRLVEHGDRAFSSNYDAFRRDLGALDDSAARVRSRATELRAKHAPALRARAEAVASEERKAAVLRNLAVLQARTAVVRDAFAPFHAALHDCRKVLEAAPAEKTVASLRDEARRIVTMRDAVTQALDAVVVAMDDIQESLRLAEAAR